LNGRDHAVQIPSETSRIIQIPSKYVNRKHGFI